MTKKKKKSKPNKRSWAEKIHYETVEAKPTLIDFQTDRCSSTRAYQREGNGESAELSSRSLLNRFESPRQRPLSIHLQRLSSRFISLRVSYQNCFSFGGWGFMCFCSGEVILRQEPYVSVPNNNSSESRCDGCFKTDGLKKCSGCQVVWYCGSSCQVDKFDWWLIRYCKLFVYFLIICRSQSGSCIAMNAKLSVGLRRRSVC